MQESPARFAAGNYCDAGGLHGAVYRGGGGADWAGAVANADGRRGAGGEHDEEIAFRHRAADGSDWRADGDDFFAAGVSAWAGAGVVRDVARRFAAADFWTGASEISHAGFFDVAGGVCGGNSRGIAGHRDTGGSFEHWDIRSEEHTSELQSQSNLVCRL